jgi:hypothetical protein
METGAFAMFDALGIRGIWEKHDPDDVLRKFEAIRTTFTDFVERARPTMGQAWNSIKRVQAGFVSDTVVVAFVTKNVQEKPSLYSSEIPKRALFAVMMAARFAGEVVRLGATGSPSWTYRGVITYGEFAIHPSGTFFVGPAVDEAAALYDRADAALIWLSPKAKAALQHATKGDFSWGSVTTREHDVPLKAGKHEPATTFSTYVTSPFAGLMDPADAERLTADLLATFDGSRADVTTKHRNTEAFLRRNLEEQNALWEERLSCPFSPNRLDRVAPFR